MKRSKERQVETTQVQEAVEQTAATAEKLAEVLTPEHRRPPEHTDPYEAAGGSVDVGKERVTFHPHKDDATHMQSAIVPRTERQKTKLEEELEAGKRAVERHAREQQFRVPAPKSPVELQIEATTPSQRTFSPAEHIPKMFSKGDKERGHRVL
jgi:hypothetical protein